MIKKRITALLTAFSFLITLIPVNMGIAFAETSAPYIEDGKILLFDFSDSSSIPSKYLESGNAYLTEMSTDIAYEGKSGSFKWTIDENSGDINIPLDKYDYTSLIGHSDATVKVRFYSEAAGSKFNLLFFPNNANFSGKYSIKYPVIAGGWQVVDFKLSDVLNAVKYSSLGALTVRFNDTGWSNYTNGGYTIGDTIYVDSIWIELPSYGKALAVPTPSVANGAAHVATDLGNNNTYTLSFAESLWQYTYSAEGTDYNTAEGVRVYEFDGSDYTETAQPYTVDVSGSTISIVFDGPLADQCAYMVTASKDAILAATGKKLSTDAEFYFSVGMDSVNFNVVSTSVNSGDSVDASEPGFTYSLDFSNSPDNYDIGKMFAVTKDGEEYTDFTVSCEEKTVTLTFPSGLPGGCDYTVTVSDDFADTNGFYISGTQEFAFSTPAVVGSDGVVFSAADSSDMTKIFDYEENTALMPSNYSIEKEDGYALTGDTTFRINHPVISSGQFNCLVSDKLAADINKYTYINYLIYSPKATDENIVLQLRETSTYSGKAWYYTKVTTDWQGWRTVSLRISDFTNQSMGSRVDKFIVNIGGWGSTKAEAGFFCIDRIWLGNELPEEITYTGSEYSYEQGFVPNDLGGDNAYSFTYSGDIAPADYSKAVTVYKYNGEEYAETDGYSVSADGDKLNVVFDSALADGDTVKITVDGAVLSGDYSVCTEGAEAVFTVNAPSPYFMLTDSSVEDGAVIDSLSELTLTFNNDIDKALHVPDYISLYRDGEKLYNVFNASINGNVLTLDMTKELTAGTYTLKISTDYTDKYGYKYTGRKEFTDVIGEKAVTADTVTIFSANNDEHMNALAAHLEPSGDITNLYSRTAKVAYTAGVSKNGWFRENTAFDATGMKYLNFWIYSPKATGNTANIAIYTSLKNNKYNTGNKVYTMGIDWQGWKLVTIPMSFLSTATTFDAFLINFGGWSGGVNESSYILVDEVWLSGSEPGAVELKETSLPDGYTDAAVSGEILRLTFGAELNSVQNPDIVITDEKGAVLGGDKYSVDFGGDSMTITFGELSPSTEYNININGVVGKQPVIQTKPIELSFTTSDGGVYLTDLSMDDTVDFQVDNMSSASANVTAVVYAVGEDNALLAKSVKSVTLPAKTAEIVSVDFAAPAGTTDIKAFVLDSKGRFVSDKYASLKSGEAEYTLPSPLYGTSARAALDVSINVNVLEASIELAALSNLVTVEISDSKGNVVSANAAAAGADGSLQYYYVFPADAATDIYTVKLNADGVTANKELSYLSKADRDEILALANGTSASAFAEFISGNAAALGIEDASDELIDDIAELVIGSDDFGGYTEVLEFITLVSDFLDNVNSVPWGEITELINDNAALLDGDDNSDIEYFTELSEKKQNIVSSILKEKLPADSITDLLSKLGDAIDEYKDENESSSGGGGSSSGGGGSSGGKSVGGSFPVASESKPYTPVESQTVFTDINDADWATDSIMSLYKEGIVSPAENKLFRPNDNITREEFVKLVVCAFAANQPAADHSFTDAVPGQWYNGYIAKAYAAGIATGYPDGSFGIGENITREDMVTIIGRTLVLMGTKLPEGQSASFSDSGEISAYARSYVDAMVSLGVVNGMGNGTFAPKAYSTRAQAAKVIASLMELF